MRPEPADGVAIGVAGAEQFNRLMWQAQHVLPAQAVCHLEPLTESETIVKLLERLIVLKTAFQAAAMRSWSRLLPEDADHVAAVTLVARPPRLLV